MADTTHMGTDRQQLSSRLTMTADSNDNMAVKIVEQLLPQTKTFESILSRLVFEHKEETAGFFNPAS